MYEQAAELEATIRRGEPAGAAFTPFLDALSGLVAAIRDAVPDPIVPASAPVSAEATAGILGQLAAYLADQDGEAIDYLIEHTAAIEAALAGRDYPAFERAVRNYDYAVALEMLNGR